MTGPASSDHKPECNFDPDFHLDFKVEFDDAMSTRISSHEWKDIPALPASVPPAYSKTRLICLVVTVTGAALLNTFGIQAAVITLPSIGRDLHIPDGRQQWVVSAYALTFGCLLLLWGRLADVYGKRGIFILGSSVITVASVALPFAPNEVSFDILRAVQGLGAAANVPTALGILGSIFPPGKAKNYAFACYGGGAPLGAIVGQIITGVIGQYTGWKWVFWIMGILAGFVSVSAVIVIPHLQQRSQTDAEVRTVDWPGAVLITCGLFALLFALTEANTVGWKTAWIIETIVSSVLLIIAFIAWQWYLERYTNRQPLMKISLFRNIHFAAAMSIMAFFFASFNNFLVYATFFFQDYQGLPIIQTALRFLPMGIVGICTVFFTANVLHVVRGNVLFVFGTLCVAIASLLFALPIPSTTTYWAFAFPAMVLSVLGADTVFPTVTLFTAQSLSPDDQALGGGLVNSVAQVGRAVGLAVSTAIETAVIARESGEDVTMAGSQRNYTAGDPAFLKGIRAANWTGAVYGAAAVFVVLVAFRGAGKVGQAARR